jgi:hypothetical protein
MALPIVNSSRYEVTIPSMDVKVEFRPFLVKEEKILMVAMESKDDNMILKAVKEILSACIFDDIDIDALTSFDMELLFIKLRSKSVGETVDLKFKCKGDDCENEIQHLVNLEDIKIDNIDDKRIIMINDEVGVQFDYPSMSTISKSSLKDDASQDEQLKVMMDLMANCIANIFDTDNVYPSSESTHSELVEFLDGLNSEQFKRIADWFGLMPTVSHNVEYKCNKCGKEHDLELRGLQSFFT